MFDVTIHKTDLAKMLGRAVSCVSAKSPQPIMSCVLLEATDDGLTVSGTDSFVAARSYAKATTKKPGAICVDANKLHAFVRELPLAEVRLVTSKDALQVTCGKSRFKASTADANVYPQLPTATDGAPLATIEANELARLFSQGGYAVCHDDTRPHLTCALLEITSGSEGASGSIATSSTDGHRLAIARGSNDKTSQSGRLAVSTRGIGEIRKLCDACKGGTIELRLHGKMLLLVAGDTTISVLLGDDSQFPPVEKVIPPNHPHQVRLARELFMDGVRRASLACGETGGVRLVFSEGAVSVTAENSTEEITDELDCDCTFQLKVGVNAKYLSQALAALTTDQVLLELGAALEPMLIKHPTDNTSVSVVMPMRLN